MKMWIARRKTKSLHLFINNKPELVDKRWVVWVKKDGFDYLDYGIRIDSGLFPEVTFENSPMEVELVLSSQEPTIGDLLNQLMELNKEYKEFRMLVGLMRHAQTYGDKQSSFQESAVDHFIKTHNIDWD